MTFGTAFLYFALAVYAIGINVVMALFLIQWRMPLSNLNRLRIYDRESLKIKSGSRCANVISIRRFQIDKNRYVAIRRSFLSMKMGYQPTVKQVDRMLKYLSLATARKQDEWRKALVDVDIEILNDMKEQVALGSFAPEIYKTNSEERRGTKWQPPVGLALALAMFTAAFPIVTIFLVGFPMIDFIPAFIGILAADNVLRRSKENAIRVTAHIVQLINITGFVWGMFYLLVVEGVRYFLSI